MLFRSSGPPDGPPVVVVTPWLFQGDPESGKAAYASLYEIGPMMDNTSIVPYTEWNAGADPFGRRSERKPSFGGGLDYLDPNAWRQVWNLFTKFQKRPTAHASFVLLEAYPMNETRFAGEASASFAHRNVRFNVNIGPW